VGVVPRPELKSDLGALGLGFAKRLLEVEAAVDGGFTWMVGTCRLVAGLAPNKDDVAAGCALAPNKDDVAAG
jgi:hypothetical protein